LLSLTFLMSCIIIKWWGSITLLIE